MARRLQWRCDSIPAILVSVLSVVSLNSHIVRSGTAVCSSVLDGGECVQTQHRSPGCTAAGTRDDCARSEGDPSALYDPGYDVPRACLSSPSDSHSPTRTVARAVTVVLYPVGIDNKYNLYVSWQTSRNDGNSEGFDIWTYKCMGQCPFHNASEPPNLPFYDRERYECLPIHNVNSRRVLFNGAAHRTNLLQCMDGKFYSPLRCNSPHIMTVMVVPQPRPADISFFDLLSTSSVTVAWTNLDRCWATAYNANCSSPVFIRPAQYFNVTTSAQSREHMNIHVEWPDSLEEVEYIVTVADPNISAIPNCTSPGDNPPCFLARGTTQVIVSMLDINKEYSVSVQVVPLCNGSSFAEHYIGCRSEECCQAKRVRHEWSSDSTRVPTAVPLPTIYTVTATPVTGSVELSVSAQSSRVGTASHRVSLESSRVNTESSFDTTNIKTSSDSHTRYLHPTHITFNPAIASTATPISNTQEKPGTNGLSGAVIGVSATVALLVTVFVACSILIIYYFVRKRSKYHIHSVTSTSSLTESIDNSSEAGVGVGGGYCDTININHVVDPPSYAVTCSGMVASTNVPSVCSLPSEGRESETTFELESLTEGSSRSTCSDVFRGSLEDEEDFVDKTVEKSASDEGTVGDCKTEDVVVCAQQQVTEKRGKEMVTGRGRSASVRLKTSRPTNSTKRRSRSFSVLHSAHEDSHTPSALILYSKGSPEVELRVIQQCLVSDLAQYKIRTVSEDTCTFRECPASWLEAQMREVSAVFCVCNKAFDEEWENKVDALSSLVPVFKQLCHGLVTSSCGRNQLLRDKIAIVLPRDSDLQYVPTYINSRPKFRLLSHDLDRMARFVTGMPEYECISDH